MTSDIERLEKLEAKVKRLENRPLTDLTQYAQLESLLVWARAARNILQEKNPSILQEIVAEHKRLQNSAQQEGSAGVYSLFGPEE
jgi:hypothetical protein